MSTSGINAVPVMAGNANASAANDSEWGVISLLKSAGNTIYNAVANIFTAIGDFFSSIATWFGLQTAEKPVPAIVVVPSQPIVAAPVVPTEPERAVTVQPAVLAVPTEPERAVTVLLAVPAEPENSVTVTSAVLAEPTEPESAVTGLPAVLPEPTVIVPSELGNSALEGAPLSGSEPSEADSVGSSGESLPESGSPNKGLWGKTASVVAATWHLFRSGGLDRR